ncbi:MAG TPA: sulfotransferase [Phycisphaerae bacterium]|nr:sulfotransferase [Phycisphaerae bacterium]
MVGSPRSGTTAVAKVLGRHRDLRLLSEARPIWYMAVPDIADEHYHWEGDRIVGRMYLDQADATPQREAVLRCEFGIQLTLAGKKRLFEKFPANLFRVRWLQAMWPDATFIHMVRDPFSTTASKSQHWPSVYSRYTPGTAVRRNVFTQLFPEYADLLATVRTTAEWFLFEWRIYIEEGERLQRSFPHQYGIFRFEDVQLDPESTLRDMCALAQLRLTPRVRRAYQTILDTRVQLALPPLDRSRCAELLGDAPDRWGYHF